MKKVLSDCEILTSYPCGGRGVCKGCTVKAEGNLSPSTEGEKDLPRGYRLSCSTYAIGDAVIFTAETGDIEGVTDLCLPGFIRDEKNGFGTVTDIGTTTVASYLFDLKSGKCIDSLCRSNPQIQYGTDVISRINYARKNGAENLTWEIRKTGGDMIHSFGRKISESVVLGNTSMLHFYKGLDTDGMAVAPFTPSDLFGRQEGSTYFPKCLSSFIGADTISAIIAADLCDQDTALILDIGTNCETVLWNNGNVYCCSSAAGPAFEGGGISCGVPSIPGAIHSVFLNEGNIEYKTIGNGAPCGLCGSGLIDAASCMLETEVLDCTGYIQKEALIGKSGFSLTQKDIRQLQLAKSAVRAGIDTLLEKAGIAFFDVEKIYLAGGFGSRINVYSCEKISLLPKGASQKTCFLGNAAAAGGAVLLMNRGSRRKSEKIIREAIYVSLADDSVFSEAFIRYIGF